jgi:Protein of unknown function (DUF3365)
MGIRLRVNAALIVAAIVGGSAGAWYLNGLLQKRASEEVVRQAGIFMEQALAVRGYTVDYIKPELDGRLAEKFLPQTVPAFAATETFVRLRKAFPNVRYKEAVLNPTNPRDLAVDFEKQVIDRFAADTSLKETSGEITSNLRRLYYVAKPIRITNAACLGCHDTPDRAPPSLIKAYGDKQGFGWTHNQLVGAQIVVVPTYEQEQATHSLFLQIMSIFGGMFALVLVAVNLALPRD